MAWFSRHHDDRGEDDRGSGRWDWRSWLERHEEKRGGPNDRDEGFDTGHCVHGHGGESGKGHGGHDHWNNGQWRHACDDGDDPPPPENAAPVIVAPANTAPMIGYGGVGSTATLMIATDADADTLVYSLAPDDGGEAADAEFFTIDPDTGALIIAQEITPTGSADGDWVYEVTVQVTDGTETVSVDLDITFTFGG